MSADTYKELKARLEWIIDEIRNIKVDMFSCENSEKLNELIKQVKEELELLWNY